MNNQIYRETVKRVVQDDFKGQEQVASKKMPRYPMSSERQMRMITNAYMRVLNEELKKELPTILAAYKGERADMRMDDASDFRSAVRSAFYRILQRMEKRYSNFELEEELTRISKMTKDRAKREWQQMIKRTFGVNILEDYYSDAFYQDMLKQWVDENAAKIQSIPKDALDDIQETILEGYEEGLTIRDMAKEVQKDYDMSKRKATLLVRDQVGTLNADITRRQQEDAGVSEYKWSDSHDERVRDCHREFNGHIYRWDDPPEEWYDTKSRGRVYTGKYYNPGESHCCRCCAIPVFNINTFDIPIQPVFEE